MGWMKGLTISSIKKHPSLIPLYVSVGGGMLMAFAYLGRLALQNPDVGWHSKNKETANERWPEHKQYKFYAATRDYSKLPEEDVRPKF